MKIEIQVYNSKWLEDFQKEKSFLEHLIPDAKIEHIGSTAVFGLSAKPVIDMMVGLLDFSGANEFIGRIERLGYLYISKYENVMPERRFFIKEIEGKRTHHIHMVAFESEFWKRHLKFRDILRSNERVRFDYEFLKLDLAKRDWQSGDDYANAKSEFINRVLVKAIR